MPSLGASPAGYSEYYIPGPEDQLIIFHNAVNNTNFTTTHSIISITAWSPNTVVYYDHWENGYTFDPWNPDKTDASCHGPTGPDGKPYCYDEKITLATRGASHTFESAAIPASPRNPANLFYDGKDRMWSVGGALAVNRVTWPEDAGTVEAIETEVYPVRPQLTTYIMPVGEDLYYGTIANPDFERVFAFIQATTDGTTVQFDLNGDGTLGDTVCTNRTYPCTSTATQITLNAGQGFILDRYASSPTTGNPTTAATRLKTGTMIKGNQTLQVDYFFCDVGSNYNSRGISAFPTGLWDTQYYCPVGSATSATNPTDIFIYNPNSAALTITYTNPSASGTFTVPANSTQSYHTATGSYAVQNAATYLQGSDVFWGFYSVDNGRQDFDWSDSLIPSKLLTDEYYIGWAPGAYPVSMTYPNASGIFVTAAEDNVRLFVDTNNDGVADQTYNLTRLQSQYIYDSADGDMSNANIYATGPVTMTYGENPNYAPTGNPGIDTGAAVVPGLEFTDLVLSVDKATNPVMVATAAGAQATYTVVINSAKYSVDGVYAVDTLPAGWAYVNNSTTIIRTDKTTSTANPTLSGTGNRTLTWSGLGNMAPNQKITITFTAQTTQTFTSGDITRNIIEATGTRTIGTPAVTQTFTFSDFVFNTYGTTASQVGVIKTSTGVDPLAPGTAFTYSVKTTNSGSTTLSNIALYDPLPEGLSYVAGSSQVTYQQNQNVQDIFASAAYTLNTGSANWTTNWTEADNGAGTAGAAGGFAWITGGVLQLRYITSNARDQFDATNYTSNNGSISFAGNWTELNDDGSATAGTITVRNQGYLRFRPGTADRSVSRSVNVQGATSAVISFAPTDTSMVAGETVVAEYQLDSGAWVTLGTYDGGTAGWSGTTQTFTVALPYGAAALAVRFRAPQPWAGTHEFRLDNVDISIAGAYVQRSANLAGTTAATLSFYYAGSGLAAGDTMVVEAASGSAFTTLDTFTSTTAAGTKTYDILSYASSATTIRFRTTGGLNSGTKYFSIDNVNIAYNALSAPAAAHNPPNFVTTGDAYSLAPGFSLYLTYNVTVNSPLETGIDSITNSACVTASGIYVAVCGDVTNIVNNPRSQSAKVGDRVWFDVDGDGVQDVGEPGFANLEVTLKDKYGATVAVTTTGGNGDYLFDGVEPGTGYYVQVTGGLPAGLAQSFPAGRSDYRTADITLTAGQIYLDADLGFKPSSTQALIGDYVWSDANGDTIQNGGEPGIGGVTVELWKETNGDGQFTAADTRIATQTTDDSGHYLFSVANPSGTYYVKVDQAQAALSGYTATTPVVRTVAGLSNGSASLVNDFGFRNPAGTFSIRDRVWFDANADQKDDITTGDNLEPGIAGVTIDLLNGSGVVIATTQTATTQSDANGYFFFNGLKGAGADYTIRITDTLGKLTDFYGTTPAGISRQLEVNNLTASIDYTAEPSQPHFGYNARGAIGDTVFNDVNGNGIQGAGELGISGISVSLYKDVNGNGLLDAGDTLVGTMVTDANGQYMFSGLADGKYVVSIAAGPSGYTYTMTDSDPATGQQQAATISAGSSDLTKDFGYRITANQRSVSGTVWNDLNLNGIIDTGEYGLASVTLSLLNSGGSVVSTATTDSTGYYSFAGLPSGTYTVKVTDASGVLRDYVTTYEVTEGAHAASYNGQESVNLTSGNLANINFGYINPHSTRAVIGSFEAFSDQGRVTVRWQTLSEKNTAGFYLYRLDERSNSYVKLNEKLLPARLHSPDGGWYLYRDTAAQAGNRYTYMLEEVEAGGGTLKYGPWTVSTGSAPPAGFSDLAWEHHPSIRGYQQAAQTAPRKIGDRRKVARMKAGPARSTVSSSQSKSPGTGSVRAKIAIADEGVYFISANEIAQAFGKTLSEIATLLQQHSITLATMGRTVAVLQPQDNSGIYFYGVKQATAYADENLYWLEVGPAQAMASVSRPPQAPAAGGDYFLDTTRREESAYAPLSLFTDPRADFWMWDYAFPGNGRDVIEASIAAPGLGTGDSAALTVAFQGASEAFDGMDHHAAVSVNGHQVGEVRFDGMASTVAKFTVDPASLVSGDNSVVITGIQDPGVPYDIFYLNYIALEYPRQFAAADNYLAFNIGSSSLVLTGCGGCGQAPCADTVSIRGFTGSDIRVFEIADPLTPLVVAGAEISAASQQSGCGGCGLPPCQETAGDYKVSFRAASGRYLAVGPDAVRSCVLVANARPSLRDSSNQANYLIITYAGMLEQAQALADYRSGKGYTAMVVDVQDIYDEFSYGMKDPEAIHDFLKLAYTTWSLPPRYVVLAGEGSFDYKNALGNGDSLIPPCMSSTADGLYVTDNAYADVTGDDGVPELAIGRIPAQNAIELSQYVDKVIAYEAASGDWTTRAMLAADALDAGGNFAASSENVAALLAGMSLDRIYLDTVPLDDARAEFVAGFNEGRAYINFIGHGGITLIGNRNLFSTEDIGKLSNGDRLPVVVAMTCVAGAFGFPGYDSLAEALVLKQGGGAVAMWTSSDMAYNTYSTRLCTGFYKAVFTSGVKVLGDAILSAKKEYAGSESRLEYLNFYNLIGDPGLVIK